MLELIDAGASWREVAVQVLGDARYKATVAGWVKQRKDAPRSPATNEGRHERNYLKYLPEAPGAEASVGGRCCSSSTRRGKRSEASAWALSER